MIEEENGDEAVELNDELVFHSENGIARSFVGEDTISNEESTQGDEEDVEEEETNIDNNCKDFSLGKGSKSEIADGVAHFYFFEFKTCFFIFFYFKKVWITLLYISRFINELSRS